MLVYITDIASLQIISPSNNPEKAAQAAPKSQPQTNSVDKMVLKTGGEDEIGQTPGCRGPG